MLILITSLHTSWRPVRPLQAFPPEAAMARRGVLSVVDWERQCVLAEAPYDSPAGACFTRSHLWLASNGAHNVRRFDHSLTNDATTVHPMFNDLHTLAPSRRGILAAVAGTDAIIEMDQDGRVVWIWMATEHGYNRQPDGRLRRVRGAVDWSRAANTTREQCTHVNSALEMDENTVLATLFTQGHLIAIDRTSGRSQVLVEGLERPHRIAKAVACTGWTVCDSGASRVALLEEDFHISGEIVSDFNWVQDALRLGDRALILDANNCRVVEWDVVDRRAVTWLPYEQNRKAFSITVVPPEWEADICRLQEWGDRYAR